MTHTRNEIWTCRTMDEMPSTRKFSCPLTNSIMEDPVAVPCCGTNFERKALINWMRKHGNRCPQSGAALLPSDLMPNAKLQWEILYLERKNSDVDCQERYCSCLHPTISPSSKADCPPIHPRSPSEIPSRKSLNNTSDDIIGRSRTSRGITLVRSTPTPKFNKDLPPTQPRSSSSTVAPSPLKRVDSAPTLPRRAGDSILKPSTMPLTSMTAHDRCGLETTLRRISLSARTLAILDEVMALLETDEETGGTRLANCK